MWMGGWACDKTEDLGNTEVRKLRYVSLKENHFLGPLSRPGSRSTAELIRDLIRGLLS